MSWQRGRMRLSVGIHRKKAEPLASLAMGQRLVEGEEGASGVCLGGVGADSTTLNPAGLGLGVDVDSTMTHHRHRPRDTGVCFNPVYSMHHVLPFLCGLQDVSLESISHSLAQ